MWLNSGQWNVGRSDVTIKLPVGIDIQEVPEWLCTAKLLYSPSPLPPITHRAAYEKWNSIVFSQWDYSVYLLLQFVSISLIHHFSIKFSSQSITEKFKWLFQTLTNLSHLIRIIRYIYIYIFSCNTCWNSFTNWFFLSLPGTYGRIDLTFFLGILLVTSLQNFILQTHNSLSLDSATVHWFLSHILTFLHVLIKSPFSSQSQKIVRTQASALHSLHSAIKLPHFHRLKYWIFPSEQWCSGRNIYTMSWRAVSAWSLIHKAPSPPDFFASVDSIIIFPE